MASFDIPLKLYMSAPVHAVRTTDSLDEAQRRLRDHRISALAVVDERDRIVGVLSRSDLLRVGRREAGSQHRAALLNLPDRPVEEVMTGGLFSLGPDDPLEEAARIMVQERVHRIFVVQAGDVPRGVVSTRDVMQAIADKRMGTPISEYMSSPLFTIRAQEPISLASDRLEKAHVTGLVVVEDGWPVGVFTQEDALASRGMVRTTRVDDVMDPAILILDGETPLYRAAQQAAAMDVRRVVVTVRGRPEGILTGIDFAGAAA